MTSHYEISLYADNYLLNCLKVKLNHNFVDIDGFTHSVLFRSLVFLTCIKNAKTEKEKYFFYKYAAVSFCNCGSLTQTKKLKDIMTIKYIIYFYMLYIDAFILFNKTYNDDKFNDTFTFLHNKIIDFESIITSFKKKNILSGADNDNFLELYNGFIYLINNFKYTEKTKKKTALHFLQNISLLFNNYISI